jgi:hypothetical protein
MATRHRTPENGDSLNARQSPSKPNWIYARITPFFSQEDGIYKTKVCLLQFNMVQIFSGVRAPFRECNFVERRRYAGCSATLTMRSNLLINLDITASVCRSLTGDGRLRHVIGSLCRSSNDGEKTGSNLNIRILAHRP